MSDCYIIFNYDSLIGYLEVIDRYIPGCFDIQVIERVISSDQFTDYNIFITGIDYQRGWIQIGFLHKPA